MLDGLGHGALVSIRVEVECVVVSVFSFLRARLSPSLSSSLLSAFFLDSLYAVVISVVSVTLSYFLLVDLLV